MQIKEQKQIKYKITNDDGDNIKDIKEVKQNIKLPQQAQQKQFKEKETTYDFKIKKINGKQYKAIPTSKGVENVEIIQRPKQDYLGEMYDTINQYDKDVWEQSEGFDCGIKSLNKMLLGIQPGFHVIGGDSNLGKSAFITQLEIGLINNNENIYLISFSLDDSAKDKISRSIAANKKIPINLAKNPKTFKDDANYQEMMVRREKGLNALKEQVPRYKVYDLTKTTIVEEIHKIVSVHKALLKSNKENKQIVITIDSFHDLSSTQKFPSENALHEYLASYLADLAIHENIAIIVTAELKKVYGNRRPMIDDIKGAGKIKYEAKSIMMVYNEVHYKGENASIYYSRKGIVEKQPVFEAHLAKNKFSEKKGRVFFYFFPDLSLMKEADSQASKGYSDLLYSGSDD